jgi:hypothetical protein
MKILAENIWLIRIKNQDSALTNEVEIDAEGNKVIVIQRARNVDWITVQHS